MGEAKSRKAIEDLASRITGEAADKGALLEIGFAAFVQLNRLAEEDMKRLREMRVAYLAGAEHVFSSIMSMMDDDREATAQDLARMYRLHREVQKARAELKLFHDRPQGAA